MSEESQTKVAIACQGGGSHSAFGAGVLRTLLRNWDDTFELVGISGTSGGAFNALATWYGLVTGEPSDAIDVLDAIWDDLAASAPIERISNDWLVGVAHLESTGLPIPRISPYQLPASDRGKAEIRRVLERHIDFDAIPELCEMEAPELVVGTVNVNAGIFETFRNKDVTPEAILASTALPSLFEAVEINGHQHWDGLFSQNPPIDDLMTIDAARKPDELWVIQINPQVQENEPTSVAEIADRRNELSGNISLNQEIRVVERVNSWIEAGYLPEPTFKRTEVHRIQKRRAFHFSTKVDRRPAFIQTLIDLGEQRAQEFLQQREGEPDTQ